MRLILSVLLISVVTLAQNSAPVVGGPSGHMDLSGFQYLAQGKYAEAIPSLEKAASADPKNAEIRIALGEAYLGAGQAEKGLAVLDKAVGERPLAWIQRSVGYWLAASNLQLGRALQYAEAAVRSEEGELQLLDLNKVDAGTFRLELNLARDWDTLGFVHFQRGDLDDAERYLHAAWVLAQEDPAGDRLGQLYEKRGRRQEAIRSFAQALATGGPLFRAERRSRLAALAGGEDNVEPLIQSARNELTAMRTVKIGKLPVGKSEAEFYLELIPAPGMPTARFVHGDAVLRKANDALQAAPLPGVFPDATLTKLFRRGTLTCSGSGACAIELLNASWSIRADAGGGVTAPVAIRKVAPHYTEEARKAKLQGTVVLHVEVDASGHARNIKVVRGLGMGLDEEAIKSVEQWEFKPGERDGKPVIVMATVEVNFVLI